MLRKYLTNYRRCEEGEARRSSLKAIIIKLHCLEMLVVGLLRSLRDLAMTLKKLTWLWCLASTAACGAPVQYPQDQTLYDQYRWAGTYYYGQTVSNPLIRILEGQINRWPEHIQSLELAYTLNEQNFLRRLVSPLVGVVQLAGNVTVRNGSHEDTIYEFDPYLQFRWANWAWNKYLNTSLAIGEGVSYTSSYPWIEKRHNDNNKRFLNYLMLEATFAAPSYPRLQAVVRIHHRSGAYGLYHAGNTGSNDIGLGMRYLFA